MERRWRSRSPAVGCVVLLLLLLLGCWGPREAAAAVSAGRARLLLLRALFGAPRAGGLLGPRVLARTGRAGRLGAVGVPSGAGAAVLGGFSLPMWERGAVGARRSGERRVCGVWAPGRVLCGLS